MTTAASRRVLETGQPNIGEEECQRTLAWLRPGDPPIFVVLALLQRPE